MTKGNHSKVIDAEAIEKWLALISAVLGQVPWLATVAGVYSLSLYQPSIYHGKEPFLLVPFMVGLFANWTALRWPNAMWVIVPIFLCSQRLYIGFTIASLR
jgi:hypothetical protein